MRKYLLELESKLFGWDVIDFDKLAKEFMNEIGNKALE